jgi:asparagine synthase (glutamine-hydrolysing)
MSAIVGLYQRDSQPVSTSAVKTMLGSLAHRGPDGFNLWHTQVLGLGHQMLHTTPESLHEVLPQQDAKNGNVITADARIDNREELLNTLGLADQLTKPVTDSQLILAAYDRWGEDCLDHLLGDFAFAIWNPQTQILFCARDHFGIKPFYYWESTTQFAFASEIKALLTLPNVSCQLNVDQVGDFLIENFDNKSSTFYQGIWRLPPAHYLTITSSEVHLRQYWALDLEATVQLESDQAYADRFRELFTEAVRCRMRSAFPAGSMLSGGLDSSAIAAVAEQLQVETSQLPLPTLSAIFEQTPECDEQPYIQAVLQQGHYQPHYLIADRRSPLNNIDTILSYADEPFSTPGFAMMTWGLSQLAQQQNLRVLLHGHDGDGTLYNDYIAYFRELAQQGCWFTLARDLRGAAQAEHAFYPRLLWVHVWVYGLYPRLAKTWGVKWVLRAWKKLSRRLARRIQPARAVTWQTVLNPQFIQQADLAARHQAVQQLQRQVGQSTRLDHHYLLMQGRQVNALETLDKAAAVYGLELRYPFWDRRLVEFCFALPIQQKLAHGWTRLVMRRGLNRILPERVQWRRDKVNFFSNFRRGLLSEQTYLDDLLIRDADVIAPYINLGEFYRVYQRFLETGHQASPEDAFAVWQVAALAAWLRQATRMSGQTWPCDRVMVPST